MTPTCKVVIRMRDVGISLLASSSYSGSLNRVRLQKFIYLFDQVAQLLKLLPPKIGHYSFKNGPFDPHIQNAVDSLAFRGLVGITSLRKTSDGSIHSEYSLSPAGLKWTRRMVQSPTISDRWRVAELISAEINQLGWERLRELVYAEPAYVVARPRGYGEQLRELEFNSPSSAAVFKAFSVSLSRGFRRQPSINQIVGLYFQYLRRYSESEAKYTA